MGRKRKGARWKQQKCGRRKKRQEKMDEVLARPVDDNHGWAGARKSGAMGRVRLRLID